jgi:hypothetical protein
MSYEEATRQLKAVIAQYQPRQRLSMPAPVSTAVMPPAVDDTPTDPNLIPGAAPQVPETGLRLTPATVGAPPEKPPAESTLNTRKRDGRRWAPFIGVIVAVVLVAGLGGYLGLRSASSGTGAKTKSASVTPPAQVSGKPATQASSAPPSSAPPSSSPATTPPATPTVTPTPTPTVTPTKSAAKVPAGWKTYTSKKMKFSVALPKGWDRYKGGGNQIYFRGPGAGSNAFVMFEMTKHPGKDPVKDWKNQERSAKYGFGGYKKISIKAVDYMEGAADWDFTWNTDTGKTRVRNRGFVADNGRGYAIYWHNLNSRWKKDKHFFDTFAATFTPIK